LSARHHGHLVPSPRQVEGEGRAHPPGSNDRKLHRSSHLSGGLLYYGVGPMSRSTQFVSVESGMHPPPSGVSAKQLSHMQTSVAIGCECSGQGSSPQEVSSNTNSVSRFMTLLGVMNARARFTPTTMGARKPQRYQRSLRSRSPDSRRLPWFISD